MIGVNDAMNQILWTKYFLDAQGYFYTHITVYQDNQASILMEKSGEFSSTKNSQSSSSKTCELARFRIRDLLPSKLRIQYPAIARGLQSGSND